MTSLLSVGFIKVFFILSLIASSSLTRKPKKAKTGEICKFVLKNAKNEIEEQAKNAELKRLK